MKLIIRNATLIDVSSSHHGKTVDLFIEAGLIKKIGTNINEKDAIVIEGSGNFISAGWCDLRANFGEPGYEHKEDLESAVKAAAAGGFTAVAITPETKPVLHSKAEIEFIKSKTQHSLVDVLPYGAITQNLDGLNLAEMYDMKTSGAIGFSNGNHAIANAGVMLRALLYVKNFNSFIVSHADDIDISNNGKMNEGATSVMLGMKSIPSIAEELIIARDLELLKYTESRIHFSHISTGGSVKLIAEAKARGLNVTCDVAIANLVYNETVLMDFDTNFKVNPPLRSQEDIDALIAGINYGTIDAIISDHRPQDDENKVVEFDNAANGMSTIQTFYNLLLMLKEKIKWDKLIEVISTNPRKILGLPAISLTEGAPANFTIFNPEMEWEYNAASNVSKSKNSPMYGMRLKGKVVMVVNGVKVNR